MKSWAKQTQFGFTIVELLIVIVVIGILAAITIVAYNGIQNRASLSSAQSDVANTIKSTELYNAQADTYPTSITDCPSPAATNICMLPSNGGTFLYKKGAQSYLPPVEVAVMNNRQFFYQSRGEATGQNEFLRYTDIAPYVDKYGLTKYALEFDIRSMDTSSNSTITLYMQNGSGTKYGGLYTGIPVTTSFSHYSTTFTASLSNGSLTEAWVAFYGTYGTGNRPVVKNLTLRLAN